MLGGPGEASLTHRGPWPSHATSNPRKFQRLKAKQAHANPLPNVDHGHEDWIKTTDWDMDNEVAPGNPHMIDHFGHVYLAMSERSDYGMSHSPTHAHARQWVRAHRQSNSLQHLVGLRPRQGPPRVIDPASPTCS